MNDIISDSLQVIGVLAIGFAIFIWGYAKGVDFKEEEKKKICIFRKIKIDG